MPSSDRSNRGRDAQSCSVEAYVGDQDYLFVSYSHADRAKVYGEIEGLSNRGFRVWYDEGIDPGNEWPEEVASALARAAFFLVFISPRSVVSKNVRNEVNFAINHEKPFLAVHLQETALPRGLELRMGDIQAIMKYRMPDAQYRRKLYKSLPPGLCAFPAGQVVAPGSAEASGSVFCNSLGNRLVQVPDAYLAASARPGGALFVASTVVSHRDYLAFVDDGGPEPWSLDGHPHATVWQGRHCPDRWLDHPVVWVAHSDALAFCEWLTRKETPRDKGRYVLPAFEQWTALARTARLTPDAVTDRPWSEGPPTAQVAADEPGFLGLHHLLGNVFEWCSDTETREGESYALTVGGGWASSRTWLRECIHHQTFGAIWCPRGWPIQDGGFRLWYVRPETRKGWFGKR